jgi:hypothetical protein
MAGLLLMGCITGPAGAQSVSADSVKAAFVYRFTDYVIWPAPVLQRPEFTIAVLDDPQLTQELERVCAGHQVKGHPIRVKLIHRQKEASEAQIVFLGAGDPDAHRRFIAGLGTHPVLIVTDEDHGLDAGSTVNFMLVDHRLRFEISLTAAARSGLKISSELLSVAARVEGHS